MRITANTYTNMLLTGSQSSQQSLAVLQQQISSGNTIQSASDDPTAYGQATQVQNSIAQLNQYAQASSQATTLTAQNNQAMTSLHKLVAQAGEYLASVNSTMTPSNMQDLGTEMSSILTQIKSIVNQQGTNGNYLFGGTANQPPLTSSGAYNSAANGDETSINVQANNPVTTGIAAGGSGTPPSSGFLYDASSGVDVIASITQAITDLNAGDVTAVQQNDVPAVNSSLDLVSTYVGSTAANMAAVQTASNSISQQLVTQQANMSNLTQTNLPNASVQLQQLEMQYQATLEAGTRIMSLSILNYMSSIPTT